jgi:hypothetical protein
MLAFVIMAENFNKHSEYIKKLVADALKDIGNYGKQKTLLLYLAIMKYYGDKGLPSSHCHSFIDDIGCANIKNTLTLMEALSNPAKIFVVERNTETSHKILEVSHEPVAFQLLEKFTQFSSKNTDQLKKTVIELMNEQVIMEKRIFRIEVHSDIREILGILNIFFSLLFITISAANVINT